MPHLFTPIQFKNVTLNNRIVMSPMCMYSSDDTGIANDWHLHHLVARAIGGAGLIMQEATAVHPNGRISEYDLGIWDDVHIPNLKEMTTMVKKYGAKIGIQLSHAGRKADIPDEIYGPSELKYDASYQTPKQLTKKEIEDIVKQFQLAAARAKEAGYDIIEIHAAHGYLISSFLSPLTNQRTDDYGGDYWKRFKILQEIITGIKKVWDGPLFVRISAEDYQESGNHPENFIQYARKMKELGVDLIDCSSGAVVPAKIHTYVGYQVKYSEIIKQGAEVATGAVGLIYDYHYAEELIRNHRSDLVFIGRAMLRDPYWAMKAAHHLDHKAKFPVQYKNAFATGRTSS